MAVAGPQTQTWFLIVSQDLSTPRHGPKCLCMPLRFIQPRRCWFLGTKTVAAQTPDIHMVLGHNIVQGYTHKPQMWFNNRCRHTQIGNITMAPVGRADLSEHHGTSGRMASVTLFSTDNAIALVSIDITQV